MYSILIVLDILLAVLRENLRKWLLLHYLHLRLSVCFSNFNF